MDGSNIFNNHSNTPKRITRGGQSSGRGRGCGRTAAWATRSSLKLPVPTPDTSKAKPAII